MPPSLQASLLPYRKAYAALCLMAGDAMMPVAEASLLHILREQRAAFVSEAAMLSATHLSLAEVYAKQHRFSDARVQLELCLAAENGQGRGHFSPVAVRAFDVIAKYAQDTSDKSDAIGAAEAAATQLVCRHHRALRDLAIAPMLRGVMELRRYAKSVKLVLADRQQQLLGRQPASDVNTSNTEGSKQQHDSPRGPRRRSVTTFLSGDGPSTGGDWSPSVSMVNTPRGGPSGLGASAHHTPEVLPLDDGIVRLAAEALRVDATVHFVSALDTAHLGLLNAASETLTALYGIVGDNDVARVPFATVTSHAHEVETARAAMAQLLEVGERIAHQQPTTDGGARSPEGNVIDDDGDEANSAALTPGPDQLLVPLTSGRRSRRRRSSVASAMPLDAAGGAPIAPYHPHHHTAERERESTRPITVCVPSCVGADWSVRAAATVPLTIALDTDRLVMLNHLFGMAASHIAEYEHLAALRVTRRCGVIAEQGEAACNALPASTTALAPADATTPGTLPLLRPTLRAAVQRNGRNADVIRAAIEAGGVDRDVS
jgi:hypothetical protein